MVHGLLHRLGSLCPGMWYKSDEWESKKWPAYLASNPEHLVQSRMCYPLNFHLLSEYDENQYLKDFYIELSEYFHYVPKHYSYQYSYTNIAIATSEALRIYYISYNPVI